MSKPESALWRLIPLIQAPGRIQMAIDSWLLDQHVHGIHPPTLRFYTWSPVAISLGYHQRHYPLEWHQLTWQGQPIDLVRRPTGGRAVLHQGDLTYAIIASHLSENRKEAYRQVCKFLIDGWRSLHLPLDFGQTEQVGTHNPNCFATATAADLVLENGAKLIGSAQWRRGHTLLQHGSMRLTTDPLLFEQVFGTVPEPIPLPAALSSSDDCISIITDTLITSARRCLGGNFVIHPLTAPEWQAIEDGLTTSRT